MASHMEVCPAPTLFSFLGLRPNPLKIRVTGEALLNQEGGVQRRERPLDKNFSWNRFSSAEVIYTFSQQIRIQILSAKSPLAKSFS